MKECGLCAQQTVNTLGAASSREKIHCEDFVMSLVLRVGPNFKNGFCNHQILPEFVGSPVLKAALQ